MYIFSISYFLFVSSFSCFFFLCYTIKYMETIGILAFIVSLFAFFRAESAQTKIYTLKKELEESLKKQNPSVLSSEVDASEKEPQFSKKPMPHTAQEISHEPTENAFIVWLKEDWLIKLGGILVFMGLMFFLSVALAVMGPQGKVAVGYLLAFSFMGFGFWWAAKNLKVGMSLNLLGGVLAIFTTYVARLPDYNLFSPTTAGAFIFALSAYIAFCAYKFLIPSMAHIGLVVAGLVPILANSGSHNWVGLFSYLMIVALSVLWLVSRTGWRTLLLLTQIITLFYSAVALDSYTSQDITTLPFFALAFGVIFFGVSLFSLVKSKGETALVDGWIALLNLVFALVWITEKVPEDYRALSFIALGCIYMIGLFFVFKITQKVLPFIVYAGASLVLFMAATVMLTENDQVLTILLILESAFAIFATHLLRKEGPFVKLVSLSAIPPIILSLVSLGDIVKYTYSYFSYDDFYTPAIKSISLSHFFVVVIAIFVYGFLSFAVRQTEKELKVIFGGVSAFLFVAGLWESLHGILSAESAAFLALIIYTFIGMAISFYGIKTVNSLYRKAGRIILGAVALRVIFVDAWVFENDLIGVLICISIGILLIATTVVTKKIEKENVVTK